METRSEFQVHSFIYVVRPIKEKGDTYMNTNEAVELLGNHPDKLIVNEDGHALGMEPNGDFYITDGTNKSRLIPLDSTWREVTSREPQETKEEQKNTTNQIKERAGMKIRTKTKTGEIIHAFELKENIMLNTEYAEMQGRPGDYLVIADELIRIMDRSMFKKLFGVGADEPVKATEEQDLREYVEKVMKSYEEFKKSEEEELDISEGEDCTCPKCTREMTGEEYEEMMSLVLDGFMKAMAEDVAKKLIAFQLMKGMEEQMEKEE